MSYQIMQQLEVEQFHFMGARSKPTVKCPKCGYIDPPEWCPSSFKWGADYTTLENFKELEPALAQKIIERKWVEDSNYLYHLSKHGNVSRVAKMEHSKESFMLHGFTDRVSKAKEGIIKNYHYEKIKNQRRLDEIITEQTQ